MVWARLLTGHYVFVMCEATRLFLRTVPLCVAVYNRNVTLMSKVILPCEFEMWLESLVVIFHFATRFYCISQPFALSFYHFPSLPPQNVWS